MKDLLTILILTAIVMFLWVFLDVGNIAYGPKKEIPQETLEISTPIDGRIDIEFLRELTD